MTSCNPTYQVCVHPYLDVCVCVQLKPAPLHVMSVSGCIYEMESVLAAMQTHQHTQEQHLNEALF